MGRRLVAASLESPVLAGADSPQRRRVRTGREVRRHIGRPEEEPDRSPAALEVGLGRSLAGLEVVVVRPVKIIRLACASVKKYATVSAEVTNVAVSLLLRWVGLGLAIGLLIRWLWRAPI